MPRKSRLDLIVPGLPHHFVLRANNRRKLFSSIHDRLRFLRFLSDASVEPEACPVSALALMTTHVHLLALALSFEGTWRWIKEIAQRYAVHRNRQHGTTGKVFEQRYGIVPVRTERQFAATTAYIDLNPVRAGIESPWTTRALHSGEGKVISAIRDVWRPSDWWQGLGADDAARQREYRDFCEGRRERWEADVVRPAGPPPCRAQASDRPQRPDGSKVT